MRRLVNPRLLPASLIRGKDLPCRCITAVRLTGPCDGFTRYLADLLYDPE